VKKSSALPNKKRMNGSHLRKRPIALPMKRRPPEIRPIKNKQRNLLKRNARSGMLKSKLLRKKLRKRLKLKLKKLLS